MTSESNQTINENYSKSFRIASSIIIQFNMNFAHSAAVVAVCATAISGVAMVTLSALSGVMALAALEAETALRIHAQEMESVLLENESKYVNNEDYDDYDDGTYEDDGYSTQEFDTDEESEEDEESESSQSESESSSSESESESKPDVEQQL